MPQEKRPYNNPHTVDAGVIGVSVGGTVDNQTSRDISVSEDDGRIWVTVGAVSNDVNVDPSPSAGQVLTATGDGNAEWVPIQSGRRTGKIEEIYARAKKRLESGEDVHLGRASFLDDQKVAERLGVPIECISRHETSDMLTVKAPQCCWLWWQHNAGQSEPTLAACIEGAETFADKTSPVEIERTFPRFPERPVEMVSYHFTAQNKLIPATSNGKLIAKGHLPVSQRR